MSWIHLQSNILEYIILNYRSLTPSHEPELQLKKYQEIQMVDMSLSYRLTFLLQYSVNTWYVVQFIIQTNTICQRSLGTSYSLQDRLMGLNSDPNTDNEVKSAILLHCVHTTLSCLHTTINHFNILQQYLISTFEKENRKAR